MKYLEKCVYHGTYFESFFAQGSIVSVAYYNQICFENDSDDSLGDAKPNHSRRFTKFRLSSKTQIDIMKAKASLRGVSTPLIEVANFLWYRIFSRIIKSCFH